MTDSDLDGDKGPGPEVVVVTVRRAGQIRWFRCNRDWWVMDVHKWRNEVIQHGYEVPEFNDHFRFGFKVVDESNADKFLACLAAYEVSGDELAVELARRYGGARSWWDVADLFPIMFVDFDHRAVAGFYPKGVPMERYAPQGWSSQFIDFATEYPEAVFPEKDKFWIKGGVDLLELLNKRGSEGG